MRHESANSQEKIWKVRLISKKVKNEILARGASRGNEILAAGAPEERGILVSREPNSGTPASRNAICTQS